EVRGMIEHVGQVRALHAGLQIEIAALRIVVVAAVAANAGCDVLAHIRGKEVLLIGGGVGAHLGCVMSAFGILVAVRVGMAAIGLGIVIRLCVRAAGVPIRLLVNLIAGVDMHVGAVRLVVGVELDARAVADVALVVAVSAVAGAVAAGRNVLQRDRI